MYVRIATGRYRRGDAGRHWPVRLALLVLLPLAACTSKPSSTPPPGSTVSLRAPSAVSADPSVEVQNAVAAYRGMWDAYVRVLAAADPDSPELSRFAAGNALQTLVGGVRNVRDRGLKGEGAFALAPRVTDVAPAASPTKVGIRDCLDDSNARIVRASPGPAYSDKPGGRRLCIATVERNTDGAWKVTSFGLHEVGTCAT